jgi:hypothetical protein
MKRVLLAACLASSLAWAQDPTQIVVDKVFANKTEAEKQVLQQEIKDKAPLQYGNGDATSNVWPQKDEDVLNNIKSFHRNFPPGAAATAATPTASPTVSPAPSPKRKHRAKAKKKTQAKAVH